MSINYVQYSYIIYAKYLAKMLRIVRLQNKKCSKPRPQRHCSGHEQYQYPFQYYLYTQLLDRDSE